MPALPAFDQLVHPAPAWPSVYPPVGLLVGGAILTLIALAGIEWAAHRDGILALGLETAPTLVRRAALRALALSVAVMLTFLALAASYGAPFMRSIDDRVGGATLRWGGPAFGACMTAVSFLGAYAASTVWLTLVGWALWRTGHGRSLRFFAATVLGAAGLNGLTKGLIHRLRPGAGLALPTYSFPSSHVLAATIIAGALYLILRSSIRARAGRVRLLAAAIAWPLLMSVSRLVLGAHYFTDVVGGVLLGIGWLAFCRGALGLLAGRRRRVDR